MFAKKQTLIYCLNELTRVERGLRLCKLLICLATEKAFKDQDYIDQINSVMKSNKPIIFLLIDPNIKWPPNNPSDLNFGDLYFYMRFFKRNDTESASNSKSNFSLFIIINRNLLFFKLDSNERFWPENKFNELKLEIKKSIQSAKLNKEKNPESYLTPRCSYDVFISYQLDNKELAFQLGEKVFCILKYRKT